MLHYWNDNWALRPEECPCDVDFTEFLEERSIDDASIFHFGTGGHHHVGIRLAETGSRNAVLGITAAPVEYEAYVKLAIERPEVSRRYKVEFGDIYLTEERLLPGFDIVTLFHLCEFRTEKNDAYGALTDLQLALLFLRKLQPGGWLLFFAGSFAWKQAEGVVEQLLSEGLIEPAGSFKSLRLYRKPAAPTPAVA